MFLGASLHCLPFLVVKDPWIHERTCTVVQSSGSLAQSPAEKVAAGWLAANISTGLDKQPLKPYYNILQPYYNFLNPTVGPLPISLSNNWWCPFEKSENCESQFSTVLMFVIWMSPDVYTSHPPIKHGWKSWKIAPSSIHFRHATDPKGIFHYLPNIIPLILPTLFLYLSNPCISLWVAVYPYKSL
jgi:hypothetical protein